MTWGLPILVGVGCYLWWRRRTWTTPAQDEQRAVGARRPWRTAAEAWDRLERPFNAAYARYRQTEAMLAVRSPRPRAQTAFGLAHQAAVTLGAEPLRRDIELLAQRGRFRLEEPLDRTAAPKAPPSPAASLGLTRREVEVLALVAEGRTNRQIGQALFITPKTASVHVSRILAKLGVAGRGRPPTRPRQAMIRVGRGRSSSTWQRVRGQTAASSVTSPWQRRPPSLPRFCYLLLAWPR